MALSCVGTKPEVCLRADSTLRAEDVQAVLHSLVVAAGSGAETPDRFVQVVGADTTDPTDGRALVINPATVTRSGVSPDLLAHYLVWNRQCLLEDEPPSPTAQLVIEQLSDTLLARANLLDPSLIEDQAIARFLALPDSSQVEWIQKSLAASNSCSFASLPSPLS